MAVSSYLVIMRKECKYQYLEIDPGMDVILETQLTPKTEPGSNINAI